MITVIFETKDEDIRLEMPAIPRAGDYIHRKDKQILHVLSGHADWECEDKSDWFAHIAAEIVDPNKKSDTE